MATITASLKDYSNEPTRTNFRIADASDDAGEATVIAGLIAGLKTAIEGVTNGSYVSAKYSLDTIKYGNGAAASEDAQRERKVIIFYEDDTTFDLHSLEIGTVDITEVALYANSDEIDITDTAFAALVTWMETNMLSKAGNSITVLRAELVGRNL